MATIIEQHADMASQEVDLDVVHALRRFTPEEYERLGELGIIGDDERVELLEGMIVTMMARRPEHDYVISQVAKLLQRACGDQYHCRVQLGVFTKESRPEPDCALVREPAKNYAHRFPNRDDIAIVVEVADTSLRDDRKTKTRIYARAGFAVYWIVNMQERQVEVFTKPSGESTQPKYGIKRIYKEGDKLPVTVDGKLVGEILVAELLP